MALWLGVTDPARPEIYARSLQAARPASPALFDAVAAEAVARGLGEVNPQGLANTAWAFARAEHAAPALFDALAEAAAPRVGEFNAQSIANSTAWAFATLGQLDEMTRTALARAAAAPPLTTSRANAKASKRTLTRRQVGGF